MTPVLGRLPDPPDARDKPLSLFMPRTAVLPLPPSYYARPYPPVLDQSTTPDCVGFSGASYRSSEERRDEKRQVVFDGTDLYNLAKQIDGYAGDGTNIRAAAKQLVNVGGLVISSTKGFEVGLRRKIASYARLNSIEDILQSILVTGGAWLGSSWYESWFSPVNGVLPYPDRVAGGHAYRAVGWRRNVPFGDRLQIRCINSWGTGWGQGGLFWLPANFIDFADFDCWSTLDVKGDVS